MSKKLEIVIQPCSETNRRLGDLLLEQLDLDIWTDFRAAVAFARFSGVKHLSERLSAFSTHTRVRISVGLDLGGTSEEALRELNDSVCKNGEVWLFHNRNTTTFHPKVYLFKNDEDALLAIGSCNLTEGGLFTNYEATIVASLNLANADDAQVCRDVETFLDLCSTSDEALAFPLTDRLLDELIAGGAVLSEQALGKLRRVQRAVQFKSRRNAGDSAKLPFAAVGVPGAPPAGHTFLKPRVVESSEDAQDDVDAAIESEGVVSEAPTGFVMTLQQTDAGVGQTHEGTARRSPEIFVPLAARNYDPSFWGWPTEFREDPSRKGKFDRRSVRMRLGTEIIEVNMMTWPVKHDFRLRSEALRSAGGVGDILRIERAPHDEPFDYYVEVVPSKRADYAAWAEQCNVPVKNSTRRWGYY